MVARRSKVVGGQVGEISEEKSEILSSLFFRRPCLLSVPLVNATLHFRTGIRIQNNWSEFRELTNPILMIWLLYIYTDYPSMLKNFPFIF